LAHGIYCAPLLFKFFPNNKVTSKFIAIKFVTTKFITTKFITTNFITTKFVTTKFVTTKSYIPCVGRSGAQNFRAPPTNQLVIHLDFVRSVRR